MRLQRVGTRQQRRTFYQFPRQVYAGNPHHRATEESLTHLLVDGPTAFHRHATVVPYLLDNDGVVGRCALIHDSKMPHVVQVAFFEALPGLTDVCPALCAEARALHPSARTLVVGVNGHLNYGAGLLLSHFDQPPVFGLPYTPPYYVDYFADLTLHRMVSFRFSCQEFYTWRTQQPADEIDGITVRCMDPRRLPREVAHYTAIDNGSFIDHPFWSDRLPEENYELFHPFRHLLDGENLLFAERNGEPLGFLLWYPDFNELVGAGHDLTAWQVLRYRLANPITTIRLAEVALLPHARRTRAVYAMLLTMIPLVQRGGYQWVEGGFIMNDNIPSLTMTRKFIERAFGTKGEPYRRYGIFEGTL
jgi:hypothetical protein